MYISLVSCENHWVNWVEYPVVIICKLGLFHNAHTGKNLVTKALTGFNKVKALLEQAVNEDNKEIERISTRITDLHTTKESHEDNKKYASKMLSKIESFLE